MSDILKKPASQRAPRSLRIGWKVLMIPNLLVLVLGLVFVLAPGQLLTTDRGSHEATDYVSALGRMLGGHMLALATLLVSITSTSLRKGERWSWYALLAGNTLGWGSAIAFDLTMGEMLGVAIETAMLGLVYFGLALSSKGMSLG